MAAFERVRDGAAPDLAEKLGVAMLFGEFLPAREASMPIKTKRWDEEASPDDGERILICQYRPRGLRKKDETWDTWQRRLGPSPKLHAAFYGKNGPPIGWARYRRRYLNEMKKQTDLIEDLAAKVAAGRTITLLCSKQCLDPERCHRTLLRGLIEERLAGRGP